MPGRRPYRSWLLGVILAVVLTHLFVAQAVWQEWVALKSQQLAPPARLNVNFVRELKLSAPPPVAAAALPRLTRSQPVQKTAQRAAPPPDPPKARPEAASPADKPIDLSDPLTAAAEQPANAEGINLADDSTSTTAPQTSAEAAAAAASAASAASEPVAAAPFKWPESTRIKYKLTGHYRGEIHGRAQVDWLLSGTHYQVHVDTIIGPSFAPLLRRSISSDGEIGPRGLVPERYDEETKASFSAAKLKTVLFEGNEVWFSDNNKREPRLEGVQDSASQFIQFTYAFSTHPEQLKVGNVLTMPLALRHRQINVVYDVIGEELLETPLGLVPAIHLKPRLSSKTRSANLSVEIWFAPLLEYLPVRLRIQQADDGNYIDLLISQAPLRGEAADRFSASSKAKEKQLPATPPSEMRSANPTARPRLLPELSGAMTHD